MALNSFSRALQPGRSTVPGLPRVGMSPLTRRSPNIGATRTQLSSTRNRPFTDVSGSPSMKLVRLSGGGVATIIRRNSRYADFITDAEMREINVIAQKMVREAEKLSRGPLSLKELCRRGHPYGRGAARGGGRRGGLGRIGRGDVSNKAIVNAQNGQLARSWSADVSRGKGGAMVVLNNSAHHAKYTAFGTRRMKAHGPYTTAPVRFLPELNQQWAKLARRAALRESALRGALNANT